MSKHLRAGLPDMPLRNWYNCCTKHFNKTRKWKTQLDWVINPVPHDLVRRIRFWRKKIQEHDFKHLYWTISIILLWNLFTCKGTYMFDWVRRIWRGVGGRLKRTKKKLARAGWPRCPRWYGRLRVQKLTLSVFNDVKSPGQSLHHKHFIDQLAPSPW